MPFLNTIPKFYGNEDADTFLEWECEAENFFLINQTRAKDKITIVVNSLEEKALDWWIDLCIQRRSQGKRRISSWDKMRKEMEHEFIGVVVTPPKPSSLVSSKTSLFNDFISNPELTLKPVSPMATTNDPPFQPETHDLGQDSNTSMILKTNIDPICPKTNLEHGPKPLLSSYVQTKTHTPPREVSKPLSILDPDLKSTILPVAFPKLLLQAQAEPIDNHVPKITQAKSATHQNQPLPKFSTSLLKPTTTQAHIHGEPKHRKVLDPCIYGSMRNKPMSVYAHSPYPLVPLEYCFGNHLDKATKELKHVMSSIKHISHPPMSHPSTFCALNGLLSSTDSAHKQQHSPHSCAYLTTPTARGTYKSLMQASHEFPCTRMPNRSNVVKCSTHVFLVLIDALSSTKFVAKNHEPKAPDPMPPDCRTILCLNRDTCAGVAIHALSHNRASRWYCANHCPNAQKHEYDPCIANNNVVDTV